jgi:sigma-E factor negative regulatory protein RseC
MNNCKKQLVGIVHSVKQNTVSVHVDSIHACNHCHTADNCYINKHNNTVTVHVPTNNADDFQCGDKVVLDTANNADDFQCGDKVVLDTANNTEWRALWWAYLMPLIITVSTLAIVSLLTNNELLAAIISVTTTTLYYITLRLAQHNLQRQFKFTISKYRKMT